MRNLGNGLTLEAIYDNAGGDISLEVVPTPRRTSTPEPASFTVLGSGLGMLLFVVRRRRRTA
jgi:PEP-CTERM motif-containing protein